MHQNGTLFYVAAVFDIHSYACELQDWFLVKPIIHGWQKKDKHTAVMLTAYATQDVC